jgi:hypothetical protein
VSRDGTTFVPSSTQQLGAEVFLPWRDVSEVEITPHTYQRANLQVVTTAGTAFVWRAQRSSRLFEALAQLQAAWSKNPGS